MSRLSEITRCMEELEEAKTYYGREDSIGEKWGRIIWECDWRGELLRLQEEGE